ncbi:MAG: phosphate ABC transporter permease subunit PstC [Rickettsiales bacterium]|jgi:phosphate transport system permease protein|nr:phosphate ABC transporter permease subunit PstC [Rickettsiales bacterium]
MLVLFLLTITSFVFIYFKRYVIKQAGSVKNLKYLPSYYGFCAVSWIIIINLSLLVGSSLLDNTSQSSIFLLIFITSISVVLLLQKIMNIDFNARSHFEKILSVVFKFASLISITITVLIVLSMVFQAGQFFESVPFWDFMLGTKWSPQSAVIPGQFDEQGSFGIIPIISGTLLITAIAMLISAPIGLISAIYLSEYATHSFRKYAKPLLEILAGIPTVVYGYFAAFTFAPAIKNFFAMFNVDASSESALAAGSVMGIMIIPFILSLSDDVIRAVPESLRTASYGLGATKSETIKKVVIPAALPGIIGAFILGVSRAIGETMIVVMAAGLTANLTINPLESVTTATAQIVTLLVGDQEFDSVKTLSAFALGMTLFVLTLILNVIALLTAKKYRERYE